LAVGSGSLDIELLGGEVCFKVKYISYVGHPSSNYFFKIAGVVHGFYKSNY